MTGILGGLGAAFLWGLSTVAASRSTRRVGATGVLAYVMAIGLVLALGLALADGPPERAPLTSVLIACGSGLTTAVGLSLAYRALRRGKVALVAPIMSLEGAFAALISVAAGERLSAPVAAGLGVAAVGLIAVAYRRDQEAHEHAPTSTLALALVAASIFGVGLVASAHAGEDLGALWTIVATRVVGVCVITLPLALGAGLPRLRRSDGTLQLVAFSGVAEVVGYVCYLVGARDGVAVAAVLASQFAAVAAVASFVLFGERLTRLQLAGSAAILAGVATVSAFRA